MWFERMTLEVWFDDYQFAVNYDIGESAVKFLTVDQLDIDLQDVALRYGYHTGQPSLRAALAEQYPGLTPDQIVVTAGASEANFAVVSASVKPGDHVIVEHPNYPSLYDVPRSLGCDVSLFHLRFEEGFRPDLDRLEQMVTPGTRLISFTHPNNPTGSMMSESDLLRLVEFVEEKDIFLMFDETYREMDAVHSLPPAATLSDKVISISTMSKAYGLPGIRIGWVATKNQAILDAILAIREQVTICNNALGEVIALHMLERKDAFLSQALGHIEKNRRIVAEWMSAQEHFEWVYPEAGVVSFPRFKAGAPVDPEAFYRLLVENYKTFAVPGRCFEMDNRYFRLGFGATAEEIEIGLQNINQALADLM
jgi:aspartate/methionine/tyrosine aminotransferase